MTPKEKAKKLTEQYLNNMPKYLQGKLGRQTAKENSLICVDEQLKIIEMVENDLCVLDMKIFWQKVKQELHQL